MMQTCGLHGACSDYTNKETNFFPWCLDFFILSTCKTQIYFYLKFKRFRFGVMWDRNVISWEYGSDSRSYITSS